MSIQNAMQSGVSGLFANGSRMSYVGNNIANSQTVGYKRQFADMVSMTAGGRADSATTVRTVSRMDMLSPGTMMPTNRATDLAVVGSGFFVVGLDTAADVNTTGHRLSRAGNFRIDEQGYMVNSAGHYLYGFAYNEEGQIGPVDRGGFRDLQAVNVGQISMRGNATDRIEYSANLPAQQTGLADPPEPFITSVEYYNSLGGAERLVFEWQPGATANEWELRVTDQHGGNYGSLTVNFHDSGANAGAPSAYDFTALGPNAAFDPATGVLELTIPNGTTPQTIEVELGAPDTFDRLTQFAGDYAPEGVRRNGSATASLSHVEITEDGVLHGVFENGSRRALYQIPIAEVVNPEGLQEADGNAYILGIEAGTLTLRNSGGAKGYIASGVLERSNVDLAQELTDLIEIQRAYSSNAKIVQTADEMLEETTRLKR